MHKFLMIYSTALIATVFYGSCSRGSDPTESMNDSIAAEIAQLQTVVAGYDSAAFSRMVSYPLRRRYPLHDITDTLEMQRYYSIIVDDSLRKVIEESGSGDWDYLGWRGWTLSNGEYLWLDDAVYAIPYMSKQEATLYDEAVRREIASLSPSLRGAWVPEGCFTAADRIYRIDRSTADAATYRLAEYADKESMRRLPKELYFGTLTTEGTAETATYTFTNNKEGVMMTYVPYTTTGEQGELIITTPNSTKCHTTTASYWNDLLD